MASVLVPLAAAGAQDIRAVPQRPAKETPGPSAGNPYGPPTPIDVQLRDTPPDDAPRRVPVQSSIPQTAAPALSAQTPPVRPAVNDVARSPAKVSAPVDSIEATGKDQSRTRTKAAASVDGDGDDRSAARPSSSPVLPVADIPAAAQPNRAASAIATNTPDIAATEPAPVPVSETVAENDGGGWLGYAALIAAALVALGAFIGFTKRRRVKVPAPVEEAHLHRPSTADILAPPGYMPRPAPPLPPPDPTEQALTTEAMPATARVTADGRVTSRLRATGAAPLPSATLLPDPIPPATDGRVVSSRLRAEPDRAHGKAAAPAPAQPSRPARSKSAGYVVRSASIGYAIARDTANTPLNENEKQSQ